VSEQTTPARSAAHLVGRLMLAEIRVFLRQPVMLALTLLLPAGLLLMTGLVDVPGTRGDWARVAGRHVVAVQCITVYFVALNILTARRHTLALKRLRTTALPDLGIIAGLLSAPLLAGTFQIIVVLLGLFALGAPVPANPVLALLGAVSGMVVAVLAGVVTSIVTSSPEKAVWTMMPLFIATMGAESALATMGEGAGQLVMRLVPMVANANLVFAGWLGSQPLVTIAADIGIVICWLGVFSLLGWRTFRWERRR